MAVLVGATVFVSRSVIADLTPIRLALLRYAIGAVVLLPFALARRQRVRREDLAAVALLGIAQFAVVVVLLNASLEGIGSGEAALLFATTPILSMLFATALRRETMRPTRVAGVLLSVAGVGAVVGGDLFTHGSVWIGYALALASAATAALCGVMYSPYLRRYPATTVSAYAMVASVIALAVAGTLIETWSPPALDASGWIDVLFVGIASAAGYYLLLFALGRTGATEVMAFLAVSPVTAAALGALFAGEAVPNAFPLGVVLVAAGLWLTTGRTERARATS